MRVLSSIRALAALGISLSFSGCFLMVPFIESDFEQGSNAHATSYAYEKTCSKNLEDPTVHFFGPTPPGALIAAKNDAIRAEGITVPRGPRLSKRERKLRLLLRQLQNGDEIVRTHAASDLGMMGSNARSAVDELAHALRFDSSKWVRRAAARSLGKIGSRQGIPALQRAGDNHRHKSVAHSAQRSLQRLSRSF